MVTLGVKRFWWILFLLLIPTQLGKHFWFEWSSIQGIRSDYLSPTLYLIDIVWLILVVINLPKSLFDKRDLNKIFIVVGLMIINILVAESKWVAVYNWMRIIQWGITIKLITNYKLLITNYLKWIVPVWIVGESLLGLAQIINNGSLQGVFYWLGERRFSLTTVGIAQMSWLGESLIRAYGTFSHPNSLAGFLLVGWSWWQRETKTKNIYYWIVWWIGLLGIIISGSRVVWLITAIIIIYNFKFKNLKNKWAYLVIFGGVVMMILGVVGDNYRIADFVGGWDKASLSKRWELNREAMVMIKDHPLFGVGAGNMVAEEFKYRQPVHNIILLILSEVGLLPILVIVLVINYELRITNYELIKKNWVIIGIILVTGMMDHYWVTLAQNRWLVAVMIGIMVEQERKARNKI